MSKVEFKKLANDILKAVGDIDNVNTVMHCATRLRFVLKDESMVNDEEVKMMNGVLGVVHGGGQYQIVIGNKVSVLYDELCSIPGVVAGGQEDVVEKDDLKQQGIANTIIRNVSGCITPSIMAMCGAGMLKGLLALLVALGLLSETAGVYIVLYAAGDAVFRYLPLIIAYSAAKQFRCEPFIAITIIAAMLYPSIVNMESGTKFLGIPITVVDYHSAVLPPIIVVWLYSKLERFLKKVVPDAAYQFVMPCISLIIMVPVAILAVGPLFNLLGTAMTTVYASIYNISPIIPGIVIGGFWQLLVVFGIHAGFVPFMLQNVVTLGYDTMCPIVGPSNFSITGATIGVFLKTKNKKMKSVSGSAAISGVLGGITEPGIYGVCLPNRRTFLAAIIGGIMGGVITALGGAKAPSIVIPGLFTLPAFLGEGFVAMVLGMMASLIVSAVLSYLSYRDTDLE